MVVLSISTSHLHPLSVGKGRNQSRQDIDYREIETNFFFINNLYIPQCYVCHSLKAQLGYRTRASLFRTWEDENKGNDESNLSFQKECEVRTSLFSRHTWNAYFIIRRRVASAFMQPPSLAGQKLNRNCTFPVGAFGRSGGSYVAVLIHLICLYRDGPQVV